MCVCVCVCVRVFEIALLNRCCFEHQDGKTVVFEVWGAEKTYADASANCADRGKTLMRFMREQDIIAFAISNTRLSTEGQPEPCMAMWVGLKAEKVGEGLAWFWDDGVPFADTESTYGGSSWVSDQDMVPTTETDCVELTSAGFQKVGCDAIKSYACHVSGVDPIATSAPTPAPTPGPTPGPTECRLPDDRTEIQVEWGEQVSGNTFASCTRPCQIFSIGICCCFTRFFSCCLRCLC